MSRILTIGFLVAMTGSAANFGVLFAQHTLPHGPAYGNRDVHRDTRQDRPQGEAGQGGPGESGSESTGSDAREPQHIAPTDYAGNDAADRVSQDDTFFQKVYPIPRNVSAYELRNRLFSLMSPELRKYSHLYVDPQKNELHVQGARAVVEMADQFLPRMVAIPQGIEVGTLPPMDDYTFYDRWSERLAPETTPPRNPRSPDAVPQLRHNHDAQNRGENSASLTTGMLFRCAVENLRDFEKELFRRFGDDPTISYVFEDEKESRTIGISVVGAEDKVHQFGKTLFQMGVLLPEDERHEQEEPPGEKPTVSVNTPVGEGLVKVRKTFTVKHMPFDYVTGKLRLALGERLVPTSDSSSERTLEQTPESDRGTVMKFVFTASQAARDNRTLPAHQVNSSQKPLPARKLSVEFHPAKKQFRFDGDKQVCEEMIRLIEAIDAPPSKEVDRKIIRLRRTSAEKVRQTVDAYVAERQTKLHEMARRDRIASDLPPERISYETDADISDAVNRPETHSRSSLPLVRREKTTRKPVDGVSTVPESGNESATETPRAAHRENERPQRRVAFKPQEGGLPGSAVPLGPEIGGNMGADFAGGTAGFEEFGTGVVGDPRFGSGAGTFMGSGLEVPQSLNILPLPLLDIILFEGSGAEFQRLSALIEDIEKLLEATESQLKVVHLRHTDCVSMNEMLYDVLRSTMLLNTKKGQVYLFPMRNPNAILLVGWGAALDKMHELIKSLDKPIAVPGSRWRAFRLRYASATLAATTVRGAFPPVGNVIPGQLGYAWEPRLRIVADVRTNSLIVFGGPNDLREVEELIRQIDLFESGPELRVQRFDMANSLANDVAQTLTNILSPGTAGIGTTGDKFPQFVVEKLQNGEKLLIKSGLITDFTIEPDPRHNKLYVTAPEYAMSLIAELIRLIDTPMPTVQAKLFQLKNGDARQIVPILESIFPSQIQSGQLNPQLAGSEGEDNFIPMRFGTDSRTNTIIAIGSQGDLLQVDAMLRRLDSGNTEDRKREVYQLKNANASRVASTINMYISQKIRLLEGFADVKSPYLQYEEAMVVVPEEEINALLIEATPKYFDEIIEIIEKMDRPPDQVVIQVLIAEVTCADSNELGAEFGFQDPVLFNRSTFDKSISGTRRTTTTRPDNTTVVVEEPVFVPAGVGQPGLLFGDNPANSMGNNLNALSAAAVGTVAPQLLSNFNMGRVGSETGFGGLVFSASSDSVNILIRALEEKRRIEILSRPHIMAMDGQLAFILVGQRVPRVAGSTSNATSTTADVEMEEVGLMLMVTPRISPDGNKVVMNIGAEKSSLGAISDGIPIPDGSGGSVNSPKINAITTKTDISASNNETVMLGGLITKNTTDVQRKVPFLGDIPVLGRLFQYNLDTVRREELLIILTPRVVRYSEGFSEDSSRIKREESARINWCLRDVVQLHGSPSLDLGIYHATAEQPVTGPTQTIYPAPVLLDELQPLEETLPEPHLAPSSIHQNRNP